MNQQEYILAPPQGRCLSTWREPSLNQAPPQPIALHLHVVMRECGPGSTPAGVQASQPKPCPGSPSPFLWLRTHQVCVFDHRDHLPAFDLTDRWDQPQEGMSSCWCKDMCPLYQSCSSLPLLLSPPPIHHQLCCQQWDVSQIIGISSTVASSLCKLSL